MPSWRVKVPLNQSEELGSVDELIFNQVADRFELAIELEIPEELRQI